MGARTLILALLCTLGCEGRVGEAGGEIVVPDLPGAGPQAACEGFEPRPAGYRTLRAGELRATLNASFGELAQVAEPSFALLGTGEIVESILAYEPLPTDAHAQFVAQVIENIATAIDEDPARGGDACLAQEAPTDECLRTTFERWGFPIFRREMEAVELASLATIARDESLGAAAAQILVAPEMLLLIELGGDGGVGGDAESFAPVVHERASYLAFTLTGAPPSLEFLEAIRAAGDEREMLRAAIQPLLQQAAFEERTRDLLTLYLGHRGQARARGPEALFDGLDPELLESEMRDELDRYLEFVSRADGNQLEALLTSTQAFPAGPNIASVLGVPEAPDGVTIESRPGVLMRAGVLADGQANTSPILRGLFVLRRLLCVDLEPPDAELVRQRLEEVVIDPHTQSLRERIETVTGAPACASCHNAINPFGFALEGYDSLGRERTVERVFEDGEVIAEHPIDSSVVLATRPERVSVETAGAMARAIATDPRSLQCFARRALEIAQLAPRRSPCTAQAAVERLEAEDGTLADALSETALSITLAPLRPGADPSFRGGSE